MAALCQMVAFFVLSLFIGSQAQDPIPFPEMSRLEVDFYQTEVQATDVYQQATAFATEYYDNSQNRGRLELLILGNRASVFYYNETNEILEVNTTSCQTWDIDESIYDYEPVFYGWLNRDPLIVGPSAALWYAESRRDEAGYRGQEKVRDILCDKFELNVLSKTDNVTLTYYFASSDWTTPYQVEGLRVPVRITAEGQSSKNVAEGQWMPINIVTDFAYFKPTITDWLAFQPPVGIGCPLRKPTLSIPKIPKSFKYSAEVFDFMKAKKEIDSDVEFQQVWFDSTRKMARLDKYTRQRYTTELYDFNTGVTYSNLNGETCTIKPLRDSMFEAYEGSLMGHIKEPGEVLNLDGNFYYMGKRRIRGMYADTFESVKQDVYFMDKSLVKLVVTVYFTREFMEVSVDGETETRVPIYYILTGWNTTTDIAIKLQYNIFAFDDVIWPQMYTSFRIGSCFPLAEDRSYFVLVMNVNPEIAAKMEGQDEYIMLQLRAAIAKHAKISDIRLPMLRADYKTTGVYVTGLMLNKPPALKQFWLEFEGETKTSDPDVKIIPESKTKEQCAVSCVDEGNFICTGFYMCKDICYLKSRDVLDKGNENDDSLDIGSNCQTYLRAEEDSSNYGENYLPDALKALEEAVVNQSITVTVQMAENTEDIVPVADLVIGEGPYISNDNQEKPYTTVINYAKLKKGDETTQEQSGVDTLNDCYKSCKDSESMACSSFSYCPDASNKQCLTSSVLVVDRKTNPDVTEDDKNCYVYSLKYLDFYIPYQGKVLLLGGEDVFNDVKSAEECAQKCRGEKKFQCRGFEFCRSAKTCVLHSKHIMDLKAGEISTSKKSTCTHFAAKFSADYYDMGYTLIDDDSDKRSEITLEECARACSEELKSNCKSFNYCPASGPYMTDSSCSLSSKMLADDHVTTTLKGKCHHYEKKETVEDWAALKKKAPVAITGYTANGFAGLVIGMLALGLVLGAIGFVLYSYFRSRSSGEGLTVRFMKQET